MSVFDDVNKFLEDRLDEFLKNNPHLEMQALEDKLRDQEDEVIRLLADLRVKEKRLENEVLETAQDVQRWHERVEKAKNANRMDLAKPAEEREAALLRQGNQLWGQLEMVKQRIQQTYELQQQIQLKRKEVKAQVAQAFAQRTAQSANAANNAAEQQWQTTGWNQGYSTPKSADPLEQAFRKWETDEELDQLKRNMGK